MSELIKAAIDIDFKAQALVEQAEKKKANLHEQLRVRKEKIYADYMKDVDDKIAAYTVSQEEVLKEKKRENEKMIEETLSMLQKHYEEKKDAWINAIVQNVLGS
ncbi:MAG: hypothetical protein EOM50_13400 [Erysipelotrichia bacterium]|nr:hypothetical protein [Erysipelotrichia bacterium]